MHCCRYTARFVRKCAPLTLAYLCSCAVVCLCTHVSLCPCLFTCVSEVMADAIFAETGAFYSQQPRSVGDRWKRMPL